MPFSSAMRKLTQASMPSSSPMKGMAGGAVKGVSMGSANPPGMGRSIAKEMLYKDKKKAIAGY